MKIYKGLDPWCPDPASFPTDRSDSEQLAVGLDWAVLAPSGHNTQPWLFKLFSDHVDVLADRSRGLAVVDPEDRELIMACAAAVTHLEITMLRFGRSVEIDWFPDKGTADLVARVRLAERAEPDRCDVELFDAIVNRQTNRAPFHEGAISAGTTAALEAIATANDVQLKVITGEAKTPVADLIAEGDRVQMADKSFRRELASWVHHNRTDHVDGIRGYAFNHGDLVSHLGPHVIRTFDVGRGQAAMDRELALHSPNLLVLLTETDTPIDWANTGSGLASILLRLTADGLAASFLNQPIEVQTLRTQLAATVGASGYPQILLRAGAPTEKQVHTPRFPAHGAIL